MDFHVITPRGSELIMQLVGGQVVIVPPAPAVHQAGPAPAPPPPLVHR